MWHVVMQRRRWRDRGGCRGGEQDQSHHGYDHPVDVITVEGLNVPPQPPSLGPGSIAHRAAKRIKIEPEEKQRAEVSKTRQRGAVLNLSKSNSLKFCC